MINLSRGLLAVCVAAVALVVGGAASAGSACAVEMARLVVRDRGGVVVENCVRLPGRAIDSVEFLRLAGYRVETRDYGGSLGEAVCSLDGAGTSPADCPSANGHWHLWLFSNGRWTESIEGASSIEVRPGDTQGWTWQTTQSNEPPPSPSAGAFGGRKIPLLPEEPKRPGLPAILTGLTVAAAAIAVVTMAIRRKPEIT